MNAYELAKAQQAYSPPTLEEIIKQQADRIAELEKQLQESALDCISAYAQADDHYARLQELEAKVRGEK